MLRNELCSNCKELLKDKVIVDSSFMKYLFIKADLNMMELEEMQEEINKIEYSTHNHHHIHKQENDTTPTFKADRSKGEGKASPKELAFRQEMLDRLKEAYDKFTPIKKNTNLTPEEKIKHIKPITDTFIQDIQGIIKRFAPDLFEEYRKLAEKRLTEKGFTVQEKPKQRQEVYTAFMKYHLFKAEMNGEYLRLDLTNRVYGNNYFLVAYGNEK